jgi:hypothetical protein
MPSFYFAIESRKGLSPPHTLCAATGVALESGRPVDGPAWLALGRASDPAEFTAQHTRLAAARLPPAAIRSRLAAGLCLHLDPAALALAASASEAAWHCLRLADATVRPLPAEAGPLRLERGDAYVAVTAAAPLGPAAPAAARFIRIRDDFNARALAAGLLDQLAEAAPADGLSVLVIECR